MIANSSAQAAGDMGKIVNGIQRATFAYMVQGPAEPEPWVCALTNRVDTRVIYATYIPSPFPYSLCGGRIQHHLALRGSTWTAGRNALYAKARSLERQQQWQFEFLVFADADAQLKMHDQWSSANPYDVFHAALLNLQPAVSGVSENAVRNLCGPKVPCASDIDAKVNAFHATAAPIFLPYDATFDATSWHASQAILIELLLATAPESVVQFNQLFSTHAAKHTAYPRDSGACHRKPPNGLSRVATHVRSRVRPCLRKKVGLAQIGGKGFNCHKCAKSVPCMTSETCGPPGQLPPLADYGASITCKPFR